MCRNIITLCEMWKGVFPVFDRWVLRDKTTAMSRSRFAARFSSVDTLPTNATGEAESSVQVMQ